MSSHTYPNGLIRTVQRRLKIWRGDASRLVFGICRRPLPAMSSGTNAYGTSINFWVMP